MKKNNIERSKIAFHETNFACISPAASLRYAAAADMGKGQLFLGLSIFEPFKSAARWTHRASIKERSSSQLSLLSPARS